MKEEEWFLTWENETITLNEDYSVHYIKDARFCPWCGCLLKIIFTDKIMISEE
jgi:hypothetical protein